MRVLSSEEIPLASMQDNQSKRADQVFYVRSASILLRRFFYARRFRKTSSTTDQTVNVITMLAARSNGIKLNLD